LGLMALPSTTLIGSPTETPSTWNWMLPPSPGRPAVDAWTVAMKLSGCPYRDSGGLTATPTLTPAGLTTSPPATDPRPEWNRSLSLVYTTATACWPPPSVTGGKDAAALTRVTGAPTSVPSIWSCTVPVGVPLVVWTGWTIAEKVIGSPSMAGASVDCTT